MGLQWIFASFAAFLLGVSRISVIDASRINGSVATQAGKQSTADVNSIFSEIKFNCQNRASGYYADPHLDCEVFHFCHKDGTRVTIPCFQGSQKHRICYLKETSPTACSGLHFVLPEDLIAKKDSTTAAAVNDATDYKISNVIPQPNQMLDAKESNTTPLSSSKDGADNEKSGELDSIFEVFSGILKEIEANQPLVNETRSSSQFRFKPSTFSRGSHQHSSTEMRGSEIDGLNDEEKNVHGNEKFLVEVYKNEDEKDPNTDYSLFQRKAKKLFFISKSDKKIAAKNPRRKKRNVDNANIHRPYAVIYAKVPDITEKSRMYNSASSRQDRLEVPFAPAIVPADVPVVPVTIETRRKKKSKSKKSRRPQETLEVHSSSDNEFQDYQQPSEQRNVLFYVPNQGGNVRQLSLQQPGIADPRYPTGGSVIQTYRQPSQRPAENPQQQQQVQNNNQATYPNGLSNVQLPNFPFQPPSFLNNPGQSSYYFDPQALLQNDGVSLYGTQFRQPNQLQAQPEQVERVIRPQPQSSQTNSDSRSHLNTASNSRPQGGQESAVSQARGRPQKLQNGAVNNQEGENPRNPQVHENLPDFHNAFYNNFPGFQVYNAPFAHPNILHLGPTSQAEGQHSLYSNQQQPAAGLYQAIPDQTLNQGRLQQQTPEQFLTQQRPAQQNPRIQSHNEPEIGGHGVSYLQQPNQVANLGSVVPHQDRIKQPEENSRPYVTPLLPPSRPSRIRARPSATREQSPSLQPDRQHGRNRGRHTAKPQTLRKPSEHTITNDHIQSLPPRNREPYRNQVPSGNFQAENNPFIPITREVPSGNVSPNTIEDTRYRNRPYSSNTEGYEREIIYSQREPERPRIRNEDPRQTERERNPSQYTQQYSSPYYSRTTPLPSVTHPERYIVRGEGQRQRTKPISENIVRNVVEERPYYDYRTSLPPPEDRVVTRRRPSRPRPSTTEEVVTNRFYPTSAPPLRNRPSDPESYSYQYIGPQHDTEQRQRPRYRQQVQIERPPSNYDTAAAYQQDRPRHREYNTYAHQNDNLNIIPTVEGADEQSYTPPSHIHHRENIPDTKHHHEQKNPEVNNRYVLPQDKSYGDGSEERRLPPDSEHYHSREQVQKIPDKDLQESPPETTTQRPLPKRKPLPPRPTFPPFPTFPPPPRRPLTTPRPRTVPTESEKEAIEPSDLVTEEQDSVRNIQRNNHQTASDVVTQQFKDHVTEVYPQTDVPEVTTRRKTRKRRPRPRRPRPTTSYSEDQSLAESATEAPAEKEITTRSTFQRSSNRWKKQTTEQPRRSTTISTTETTANESPERTEKYGSRLNLFGKPRTRKPAFKPRTSTSTASPTLLKEESKIVPRTPNSLRSRSSITKKIRKTTTTTTTESPETTETIVSRSDHNTDFLNYESTEVTSDASFLYESESATQMSVNDDTSSFTTEAYNEMVETTEYASTLQTDSTTESQEGAKDKAQNFESRRGTSKKFQNRPRVLKFGKPKLRTTTLPTDLNAAESRNI
ncbi:hypothetical protein X975_16811, partial [Stegodyphus mimosarum]